MSAPIGPYEPYYPDGWHNLEEPNTTTPITKDALNHIEQGIAGATIYVQPEQFDLGSDSENWQACLTAGASSSDHVVVTAKPGTTYLWTTPVSWASGNGSLTVRMDGATISYTGSGSAITCLTSTGGNNPPVMRWIGGTYTSATCTKFFDCTDVRSSLWMLCTFNVTAGIAVKMTNVNSFCERNKFLDCYDNTCQQVLVMERGFKATTSAVTFTTGTNQVTQAGHGFSSGDWVQYATVGTSGLTTNQTYFVATVVDGNTYTLNTVQPDAFGNFDPAHAVTFPSTSSGTALATATGSFARTRVERLHITGGVYGFAKIEINNCGPYDSQFGPIVGNIPNGVGVIDFQSSRSIGNTKFGPILVEASDDGKTITGSSATNVITVSAAPPSRALAVGQAVQLTGVSGGSGVVSEQTYFIKTLPSATTFTIAATPGGSTVALGTDITGGNFWNTRPWKYRWGQASGQPPILDEPATLRNLALFDPATFNAGTSTTSIPDGTLKVWQSQQSAGIVVTNSKHYSGVDIYSNLPTLGSPINPAIYLSDGTIDQVGGLIIQAAHQKGLYLLDGFGNVVLGVDHLGVLTGSALSSTPGSLITEAVIDFTSTKTDATTTSTTGSDITADGITAAWTGVVASSLDCTFVAPASGVVRVEIEALLKVSATGSNIRFQINDVTGSPTMVTTSPMAILQAANTTNIRARYSRKFSVTAGQTYVWRPQWLVSGAVTATMSVGAQNGPVRMSVFAWK